MVGSAGGGQIEMPQALKDWVEGGTHQGLEHQGL